MPKRSFRRLAVVAGAALAVGSMAPAMASRIDVGAGAGAAASVDPVGLVGDVTSALPLPDLGVVALPTLPSLPTITDVNGTVATIGGVAGGLGGLAFVGGNGLLSTALGGLGGILGGILGTALPLGGNCGVVSVACGSTVSVPVVVAGTNILGDGILNGAGIGSITAPVTAVVNNVLGGDILDNVLGGDILGGGLLGGGLLDGILGTGANVNVLAAVVAAL